MIGKKISSLIVSCIIIDKKKNLKDEGVLVYLSLQSSIHWIIIFFFVFFNQCFFKKNYCLILNFFIGLSHFYDIDRGLDELTCGFFLE